MTVREYIEGELESHKEQVAKLVEMLCNLPPQLDGTGIGELESDNITIYSGWLILRDTSHKDLGAKLATITGQTLRFRATGTTRTAVFKNVGPFYKVDLDRPNPKCRKVRVLKPAKEVTMEICGDIPDGYELLEELDGTDDTGD